MTPEIKLALHRFKKMLPYYSDIVNIAYEKLITKWNNDNMDKLNEKVYKESWISLYSIMSEEYKNHCLKVFEKS